MSTGRVRGLNNHAGDLIPQQSAWGQALASGESELIDQPIPIGRQRDGAFYGTVGGITTRSASITPLFTPGGYWGDLPQDQQPLVSAPQPWDRV